MHCFICRICKGIRIVLLFFIIFMRFFVHTIQFDILSAVRMRDSFKKTIYSELFRSLINKINGTPIQSQQYIEILDIAGFGMSI